MNYQPFNTNIRELDRNAHQACLTWLARYAQLGQENPPPDPTLQLTQISPDYIPPGE
jgi:hypothetical protein